MSIDTPLAQLAIRVPAATRVFHRHGLDYCCQGRRTLADACADKALDPAELLAEIEVEEAGSVETDWSTRPLAELIDHVVTRYHERLREELPRLLDMARKVERVHGAKPTCPHGLADHLEAQRAEVERHLQKEERILFPMLRAGRPAHMPVQVMVQEHEDHAQALRRTRALTGDLVPPPGACATWRALYLGLSELERELMEHVHLENHVLFPRGLREAGAPA